MRERLDDATLVVLKIEDRVQEQSNSGSLEKQEKARTWILLEPQA